MEIKRTTEIFVETKRRFIIQPLDATHEPILCPECSAPMMTAEQIAVLLKISRRTVYQKIERGAWHFVETEAGAMFVCPPSLDAAIGDVNDAPPAEIVKLLADSATENQIGEIEIQEKVL